MKIAIKWTILNLFFLSVFGFEEDFDITVPKLIEKYNYPVEVHTAMTSDGYELTLHRIPSSGIPVLITHSLACSSASWVDNMNDSLGFILADEKFDVWLGNFRGNSYTNHSVYSLESHEFWDFTADDMAEFDLTSYIDYILTAEVHKLVYVLLLTVTNYSKILYIGQSLGTLVGFILFSSKPEYNDKVAGFVALAPVASVRYITSPAVNLMRKNAALVENAATFFDAKTFLYFSQTTLKTSDPICSALGFCNGFMHVAGGYNPNLRNLTRFGVYSSHCRYGTSMKNLLYLKGQNKDNLVSKFDYGKKENLRRYGQGTPPSYNISAITVPTALFTAANNALASPLDVQLLKRQLRSLFSHEVMSEPLFSHLDFIWLHPAKEILFGKVVKTLKNLWDKTQS